MVDKNAPHKAPRTSISHSILITFRWASLVINKLARSYKQELVDQSKSCKKITSKRF